MTAKKIALFIDADNVSPKFGKQIFDALNDRGELFIRRIYGNWEKSSLHGWNTAILNFSLHAVQQPDFVTGKNATDMCLTIDAMDKLHEGKADIFAIVSNDSDFTPLVIRLREGGMTIIGLGNSTVSTAFRAACDEFIDLDALAETKTVQPSPVEKKILPAPQKMPPVQMSLFGEEKIVTLEPKTSAPPVQPAPKISPANPKVVSINGRKSQSVHDKKIQQIHNSLRESATIHAAADGFCSLNQAGHDLKSKNFNFTVRDFGYAQLKDFVVSFAKLYETRQDETGQNFCYRLRTNEPTKSSVDKRIVKMHDTLRKAVAECADAEGFANLCTVGGYVTQERLGFGVKNLGYGALQKFIAAFPALYEIRKDGNKAFLRCRVKKKPVAPVVNVPKTDDANIAKLHEVLRSIEETHRDETGFTDLSYVGNCLGKQKIGFGIRSLGYGTLQKFVADFPDRYELRKTDKKFFYRSREVRPQISTFESFDQLHDVLREMAKTHAEEDGFVNIFCVGDYLGKKKLVGELANLSYGKLIKFVSDNPDLYATNQRSGNQFFYRCREVAPQILSPDKSEQPHESSDTCEIPKDVDENSCDAPQISNEEKLRQLHEILHASAESYRDETGFSLLNYARQSLKSKHLDFSVKDFGYEQLREFISDFPDLYEVAQDEGGRQFRYRCKA